MIGKSFEWVIQEAIMETQYLLNKDYFKSEIPPLEGLNKNELQTNR